ncbi:hypothetical protein Mpsy_2278 [Methanolobus psychrophilus R15]|nr:hypothetical protein Mpsy_2278 [Methanolobus psychrophilus R15]
MTGFKVSLDRIEGDIAVLLVRDEESIKIDIPLSLLPEGSREGDILDISILRDENETEDIKKRVSLLLEKLKNKKQ